MTEGLVFHVELRQFPNTARKFNLTQEQLHERVLSPWLAGVAIELEERRWSPDKAKLTIYEGPALTIDQMGLGRGWANVTRLGRDVTAELVAEPSTPAEETVRWLGPELLRLGETTPQMVLALLQARHPRWRASERLAVAERVLWEQLHRGEVRMLRNGEPVPSSDWESAILDWETWTASGITFAKT